MYNDSNYRIKATDVLDQTNGGLDIIYTYYPDARDCVEGSKKFFKKREEKTASARITKTDSGAWVVTDFGADQLSRNAIEIVRMEEGYAEGGAGFKESLNFIVNRWNLKIEGADPKSIPQAKFSSRPATKDEKEGECFFDIRRDGLFDDGASPLFTDFELKEVLGPFVTAEHCSELNFYPLKSYTRIKDRKAMTFESTDNYPIFLIDEGEFQKIYQPKAINKQFRFSYAGKRPKEYVFGLDLIQKVYARESAQDLDEDEKEAYKIPRIILCMGDRDALNVRSLDKRNFVIWLNSESQTVTGKLYKEIMSMTDHFYQVPDLDATGYKHGVDLATKFLDLRTIWLPKELLLIRDFRGNPCKDVTDFIRRFGARAKSEFESLIFVSPTARFWDERLEKSKDGKYTSIKYDFNNVHAYYFLNLLGIYRFQDKNNSNGYVYIHIKDNIVREILPVEIKNEVNQFLTNRRKPSQLRNMVYKTTQLNENSLSNVNLREVDFTDFGRDFQYLFFTNKTWKVTGEKIEEIKQGDSSRYVWGDEVVDHKVKLLPDFFEISKKADNDLDITIKDNSCLFFKYLIQTSRVHWRKELEDSFDHPTSEKALAYFNKYQFSIDGPNLDSEEIYEQKMHLINKIYGIGYFLHRYKDPSKPWAGFAMDNKISDDGESHGGSGKSICFNGIRELMRSVYLNGKNRNLTKNPHIFEKVTEHTKYMLIDDADKYFDFDFFFNVISGDLEVNPKGTTQYTIPFAKSPKVCLTSNHTLRDLSPSVQRRILYFVFSDYYHHSDGDDGYTRSYSPRDEFGKNLIAEFDEKEWNHFLNFLAQCLKFYLHHGTKINPPMGNVRMRNLRTEITDPFMNWADVYFGITEEFSSLNMEIEREAAYKNFKESTGSNQWKIHRFTKSLKAWCKYHGFTYNPEDKCNNGNGEHKNRIVNNFNGKSVECFYIEKKERAITMEDFTDDPEINEF